MQNFLSAGRCSSTRLRILEEALNIIHACQVEKNAPASTGAYRQRKSALVNYAAFHNKAAIGHGLDILSGVAAKGDDVGLLARFKGANLIV